MQVRCYVDNLQVWSDLYTKPVLANAPFPSKYGGIIQPLRIKNLALEFLETNDVQGFDAEKDAFGLALVELLHHLVYYGFFNHTIEWVLKHEVCPGVGFGEKVLDWMPGSITTAVREGSNLKTFHADL